MALRATCSGIVNIRQTTTPLTTDGRIYHENVVVAPQGKRQAAAIALRAPCSGIEIQESNKQTPLTTTCIAREWQGPSMAPTAGLMTCQCVSAPTAQGSVR